jgi:hypothetical protein
MIRFVRTATVAPGKLADALVFAKQIAEYLGKNHGQKLEVMVPVGGNPIRIAWRTEYASLGALEEFMTKTMSDPKYAELLKTGGMNFVAGSLNDSIWKTL